MQTKTKTKRFLALLSGAFLALELLCIQLVFAGSGSATISQYTLHEDSASSNHATTFDYVFTPKPTDQVTTNFTTNGECLLGHNDKDHTTAGSVVSAQYKLPFGIYALDDGDYEGEHLCEVRFSTQSSFDPEYNTPVVNTYNFVIKDNDAPKNYSYNVRETTATSLKEGAGYIAKYQIEISLAPTKNIAVVANADSNCDLLEGSSQQRVKSAQRTFKAGSLSPISFTLAPVDDAVFEGLHQCRVTHISSTLDTDFADVIMPPYVVAVADNDTNRNIPDQREYEGGLIYYMDANFDGIDDKQQPNVKSFINEVRDARQALMITDDAGNLLSDCAFVGPIKSIEPVGSMAETSKHGEVQFEVTCDSSTRYQIRWLLDEYDRDARNWQIYDSRKADELLRLDMQSIIFDLSNAFTTALVIDLADDGNISLTQAEGEASTDVTAFSESLQSKINNTRLNPIAITAGVIAFATITWLIWRRYFGGVNSRTNSRYPRVDRF